MANQTANETDGGIRLKDLETFVEVATSPSQTATARARAKEQSTVSRRLIKVAEYFRSPLFLPGNLGLTEKGAEILPKVKEVLEALGAMREPLPEQTESTPKLSAKDIRIG